MLRGMSDLKQLDDELNQMIANGRGFPDGFDKFYADDVVMVEAAGEECKGKEANRRREIEFLGSIAEFHGVNLVASAVGDGVSFSEWEFDLTFVGGGSRVKMQQVARRRWKDGKVVHERFYYNA